MNVTPAASDSPSNGILENPLLHFLWRQPWVIALLFFTATLILDSRHNGFPYYYNFDEPTKTAQVLTGARNFYHPPLLLNTTALATRLAGTPRTDQAVVVAGRTVSAFFTALSIAALSILAFRMAGPVAALCAGALTMTHSMVFELAHFMKEDPALLAGLCLTFLALKLFSDAAPRDDRSRIRTLVFLAITSALALSGKYVGIAGLILALLALTIVPRGENEALWKRYAIFFGVFFATLLLLDAQLLTQLGSFRSGLDANVGDLGRERKWTDVPHFRRVAGLYAEMAWPVGVFFLFQAAWQWMRDRRNFPAWICILYPLVYTAILTFSPRLFSRHFLPIFVMIHFVAALGIVHFAETVWRWKSRELAVALLSLGVCAAIASVFLGPRLKKYYDCFSHPSRERMVAWIKENLPADAVLAEDKEVFMNDLNNVTRPDLPQKVITVKRLCDFKTLAELRAAGVTHVIAHERWSGQYLKTGKLKKAKQGKGSTAPDAVKSFYSDLKNNGRLVWKTAGGSSGYLAPGLQIYALE